VGAREAECAVHAWALMGNHVHLLFHLVRARGAARLVPVLVRANARHLASAYGHVDAVWEEPYDATPVHTRAQLLFCMRYIEENPVHAGLALRPAPGAGRATARTRSGEDDALVAPHPHYCSWDARPRSAARPMPRSSTDRRSIDARAALLHHVRQRAMSALRILRILRRVADRLEAEARDALAQFGILQRPDDLAL